MSTLRVQKKQRNFTVIDNGPLTDNNLSLRARGLFAYLLTKPDDWQVQVNALVNELLEGRDTIYATIRELGEAGYITKHNRQSRSGEFAGIEYVLHEEPVEINASTDSTVYGKAVSGEAANFKPVAVNPDPTAYVLPATEQSLNASTSFTVYGATAYGKAVSILNTNGTKGPDIPSPSFTDVHEAEVISNPNGGFGKSSAISQEEILAVMVLEQQAAQVEIQYSPAYERFWSYYGRKGNKRAAYKRWKEEKCERLDPDIILSGVRRYLRCLVETDRPKQDAERWVHDHGWESEWAVEDHIKGNGHLHVHETVQERKLREMDEMIAEIKERGNGNT